MSSTQGIAKGTGRGQKAKGRLDAQQVNLLGDCQLGFMAQSPNRVQQWFASEVVENVAIDKLVYQVLFLGLVNSSLEPLHLLSPALFASLHPLGYALKYSR